MIEYFVFFISMAVLIWGADILIMQSERIALHFGISEFIIGATLVAIGTSLPELAASIAASIKSRSDIAVSNVIGSNIINITLVLGAVFLIAKKITPNRNFFAKDSLWALMPVFVFILTIFDAKVERFDGFILLLMMVAYLLFLLHDAKNPPLEELNTNKNEPFSLLRVVLLSFVGLSLVAGGAHYAIESAVTIAHRFSISEWIVGIILIAAGTSLPELIVSVMAAIKGKVDMAIGNVIGSNMANTSVVLGTAALINPLQIDLASSVFDIALMGLATLILVFITATKLYTKSAGLSLTILLALFLNNIAIQL